MSKTKNRGHLIGSDGKVWYRIVDLAKELGVTEQTIRNWTVEGKVIREKLEGEARPRVRLADGVRVVTSE